MSRFFERAKDASHKKTLEYALENYAQKIKEIIVGEFNCDQILLAKYETLYSISDLVKGVACLTTEELQEMIDLKNTEHQIIQNNANSSLLLRFRDNLAWKSENIQRLQNLSAMIVNGCNLNFDKREDCRNNMLTIDRQLGLVDPYNLQNYDQYYQQTAELKLNMTLYTKELKAIETLLKYKDRPSQLTEHYLHQWALNKMLYRGRDMQTSCLSLQETDDFILQEQIFGKQIQVDQLKKERYKLSQKKVAWSLEVTEKFLLAAKKALEELKDPSINSKSEELLTNKINSLPGEIGKYVAYKAKTQTPELHY